MWAGIEDPSGCKESYCDQLSGNVMLGVVAGTEGASTSFAPKTITEVVFLAEAFWSRVIILAAALNSLYGFIQVEIVFPTLGQSQQVRLYFRRFHLVAILQVEFVEGVAVLDYVVNETTAFGDANRLVFVILVLNLLTKLEVVILPLDSGVLIQEFVAVGDSHLGPLSIKTFVIIWERPGNTIIFPTDGVAKIALDGKT